MHYILLCGKACQQRIGEDVINYAIRSKQLSSARASRDCVETYWTQIMSFSCGLSLLKAL